MSKGQTLRALVSGRLAAAAEDIFVLFERTIAAFEEELCRSKEENQRKQQLLDKVLSPRITLVRGNVHIPSTSPGSGLKQKITETPQIKEEPEEQSIKQEEEQLPVPVPESSAVCVKTEESPLHQQRQTEPYFCSETEGQTEHSSDTDNDDDWAPPFSCSAVQMETEADGDHNNQLHIRDRGSKLSPQNKSVPETTVHNGDLSGAEKEHQCSVCQKKFGTVQHLQMHMTVHAGEDSYSDKTFALKNNSIFHKDAYQGKKLYSCSICQKTFFKKCNFKMHNRKHTGEKPFSCSICEKTFIQKCDLNRHKRRHTGEKPFSCSICEKTFVDSGDLKRHKRTHTGERPFSCSICGKAFADIRDLKGHKTTHTGEKPFSCSVCKRTFARYWVLKIHKKTHTERDLAVAQSAPKPLLIKVNSTLT